ncbi:MAG: hypothetical protein IPQ14_12890, partial [Candidatus Microthrix sp.]
EWATVRALSDHKRAYAEKFNKSKVEMWILFSTSGMVRMLGKNREAVGENRLLDKAARLYGASGPLERVWEAKLAGEITGGEAQKAYLFLYMDRLADLGYRHLLVRPIRASRGELYAMVFASDHPAGATIMQWAQERDRALTTRHAFRCARIAACIRRSAHWVAERVSNRTANLDRVGMRRGRADG